MAKGTDGTLRVLDLLEPASARLSGTSTAPRSQPSTTPPRLFLASERVYTIHATKKLRDRVTAPLLEPETPSTSLGNWYAPALFWKPQVALFVNETTLGACARAAGSGQEPG